MKRALLFLGITTSILASCSKEIAPVPLTRQQIKQKVDSIMAVRNREMEAAGQQDLQYRLKIEVKVKADSILKAQNAPPVKVPIKK